MHWWPNQIASIRSGAWILIPNEHTDQDTSDVSSKTNQDTDQDTWILISNLNYHAINYSLPKVIHNVEITILESSLVERIIK